MNSLKNNFKIVITRIFFITTLLVMVGCNNNANSSNDLKTDIQAIQTTPIATMVIKDYGTVTIELYPDMAPNTVNNFIILANEGFYDGLTFHRIIKNFMIQGGDPNGNGTGGPGYSIAGEFSTNGYEANTLLHTKGVISMARALDPNSAGSQFFIMTADTPSLDGSYAAFGKVTSGLEVVEKIGNVDTDGSDKPIKEVIIESIRVDTNNVAVPTVTKIEN